MQRAPPSPPLLAQRNGFIAFLHDAKVLDSGSHCTLVDFDRIWASGCDDMVGHGGLNKKSWVTDGSWMPGEFLAGLIRSARNKYLLVSEGGEEGGGGGRM